MKNVEKKSEAVDIMLSASLEEYLMFIQNISPKLK
jgi:hypothetical protein